MLRAEVDRHTAASPVTGRGDSASVNAWKPTVGFSGYYRAGVIVQNQIAVPES